MHWTKIEGSFVAQGGEQFIVIGNFHDQANTDTIKIQPVGDHLFGPHGYYYVDDVCVTTDTTACDFELQVNELTNEVSWYCYVDYGNQVCWIQAPNPVTGIELINVLGQFEEKQKFNARANRVSINTRNLPMGCYLVKATTEKGVFIAKVLVIH